MDNVEGKRIFLKRKVPNPLFQNWLEELHEEAAAKKSKLEPMLKEALESLAKYPLYLHTGADCAILKGFDKRLCAFLDKRLEVFNVPASSQLVTKSQSSGSLGSSSTSSLGRKKSRTSSLGTQVENIDTQNVAPNINLSPSSTTSATSVKPKNRKPYKPAFRSGSYAILVALLEYSKDNQSNPFLNKEELIEIAQKYSEESFVRAKPESFYTAWSNMSTLIKKGLVNKTRSKKVVYSLSEQGTVMAKELLEDTRNTPTVNDLIFNGIVTSVHANANHNDAQAIKVTEPPVTSEIINEIPEITLHMAAGSFDVILLIDKHETGGLSKKNDPTVAQFNKYPELKHEYRSLKVGDFTWIAKHKINKDLEFVLPYVVERKRMDDLGASIKDGRFHEQKFRLRKCGLQNVIYLIENYGSNTHVGLPIQSLMQALANTRVQDNFKVHVTESLSHSARFLAMMTKRLTIEYKDKDLNGSNNEPHGEKLATFDYFNKSSAKNKPLTVTETFIKLLLQLRGVSVEKALAITKIYSTPRSLIKEYEKCTQKEGEMLLTGLKYGDLNRKVGPSVSKAVYQLFVWEE